MRKFIFYVLLFVLHTPMGALAAIKVTALVAVLDMAGMLGTAIKTHDRLRDGTFLENQDTE